MRKAKLYPLDEIAQSLGEDPLVIAARIRKAPWRVRLIYRLAVWCDAQERKARR